MKVPVLPPIDDSDAARERTFIARRHGLLAPAYGPLLPSGRSVVPILGWMSSPLPLVEVTEESRVVLQFGGGCQGCGAVAVTLKQGIESLLKYYVPEVETVEAV